MKRAPEQLHLPVVRLIEPGCRAACGDHVGLLNRYNASDDVWASMPREPMHVPHDSLPWWQVDMAVRGHAEILDATEDHFARLWFYRDGHDPSTDLPREGNAEGRAQLFEEWYDRHGDRFPIDEVPTNDYELGRLEGRLETLRWVLGDDWGSLDT